MEAASGRPLSYLRICLGCGRYHFIPLTPYEARKVPREGTHRTSLQTVEFTWSIIAVSQLWFYIKQSRNKLGANPISVSHKKS